MIYTVPYAVTDERVDVRLAIDGVYRSTDTPRSTTYEAEEVPVSEGDGYRVVRRYRRAAGRALTLGAVSSTLVDEGVEPDLAHVHHQRFTYFVRSVERVRDAETGYDAPAVPAALLAMARAYPAQ